MSVLTITVCLMGILFFMAGCLQIGFYVGTTPMVSLPAYLPGLLLAAWPLAIAAIIFALLDVRLNLPLSTPASNADDDIPESPMRPTPQKPAEPQPGNFSYFAIPQQQESEASPSAPTRPTSQQLSSPAGNSHSRQQQAIFATPPPFRSAAAAPEQQPQPPTPPASESQQQEDSGLSFFKL